MALSETAKVPNGSPTSTPETRKCQVQALRRSVLRRDTHLSVFSRLTRNVGKHHASIPYCRQPQHQTPHRMQGRTLRCHRHRFKVAQQAKAETGTDLRQESLTNQYRGPSHLPTSDGLGMQNTATGRGAWRGLPAIARPCIRAKSAQYPKINRAVR